MIHCNGVRQTARIISMDKTILRTGDRALVTFRFSITNIIRFIKNPEYIKVGSRLLFREGRTKGLGKVVSLTPMDKCPAA